MKRVKSYSYCLLNHTVVLLLGITILSLLLIFANERITLGAFIPPIMGAGLAFGQFIHHENRSPVFREKIILTTLTFLITIIISAIIFAMSLYIPKLIPVFISTFAGEAYIYSQKTSLSTSVLLPVSALILFGFLFFAFSLKNIEQSTQEKPNRKSKKTFFEEVTGENTQADKSETSEELQTNIATAASKAPSTTTTTDVTPDSDDGWKPVNDAIPATGTYDIERERPPIFRWLVGALLLLAILAGAIWLVSKVVVPRDLPKPEVTQNEEPDKPVQKVGADDAAWVKALEKDTLAGYREYLEAFPEGKHADEAKAEIAAYDEKAWARAQERDTIAGYEEYIKEWPEGQYVEQARDRIKQIKDAAEAARKAAAAKIAAEKQAWQTAAGINTVESYQNYLNQHSDGPNAPEAQKRIDRLNASAADNAAWNAAKTAHTVGAYQQYLTSFPQGAFAPQAIAAIENLRPSPGRTFKDCQTCPEMVSLPAGTAELGAGETEKDARPNEKPSRPVTFADMYAISVSEVTFAQYDACVDAGGCSGRPNDNGWGRGNRPVINVTWDNAQKYVAWLSAQSGKRYALPTEAQWEYAARAGDTKPLIGGSAAAICAFANGAGNESGFKWSNTACTDPATDRTMPAGLLGANKFGVKDMIGNVAEWTQDCNTLNLRDAPTDGTADSRGSCNQRSVRGGSWFSGLADLRYAARLMQRRGDSNDFTGIRVVRKTGP